MSEFSIFDKVMLVIFCLFLFCFVFFFLSRCIRCPKEKENIVVEHLGKFSKIMTSGPNIMIPFIDRTKFIYSRYLLSSTYGVEVRKKYSDIISTQSEVMDFPKQ